MFCPKCGKENEDDAEFCIDCSGKLKRRTTHQRLDELSDDMDRVGKEIGRRVEAATSRVEDRLDGAGRRIERKVEQKVRSLDQALASGVKYCSGCGEEYWGRPDYCTKCGARI